MEVQPLPGTRVGRRRQMVTGSQPRPAEPRGPSGAALVSAHGCWGWVRSSRHICRQTRAPKQHPALEPGICGHPGVGSEEQSQILSGENYLMRIGAGEEAPGGVKDTK